MEQLIVTIKNGKVEIEVEGAKGTRCLQLTHAIENVIGKVDDRFLKNDFYKDTKIEQGIHLKQFDHESPFR
jgi:hypothetical protein